MEYVGYDVTECPQKSSDIEIIPINAVVAGMNDDFKPSPNPPLNLCNFAAFDNKFYESTYTTQEEAANNKIVKYHDGVLRS